MVFNQLNINFFVLCKCLLLFILINPFGNFISAFLDLEENIQDFVIETKKMTINGYPDAFNPSIVRWNGSLLMSFRIRDPLTGSTNKVGFTWLDEQFNPLGNPYELDIQVDNPSLVSKVQDPRLIMIANELFIVYSNIWEGTNKILRKMCVAKLHFQKDTFFIDSLEKIANFEGSVDLREEKNWVPFDFEGNLYLAYSLNPHRILTPLFGTGACKEITSSNCPIQWKWGELRGGTPALRDGDHYIAFFHSSKKIATIHSNGKSIQHYVMGAYTFSGQPPFNITGISPKPIVGKNFYNGPAWNTWQPLRVVFPCGFVFDENNIWIVYGRQDHEIWIVKLDKRGLLSSLVHQDTKID